MEDKLQEFFENHDIAPKKQNARSYIFDCPACGGNEKLYIEKENGRSICFKQKNEKCPTTKTGVIATLALISELSYEQVKNEINGRVAVSQTGNLPIEQKKIKEENKKEELVPVTLPVDFYPLKNNDQAYNGLNYLIGRGFNYDNLSKYSLGYSPSMRRVIFPVIMNGILYGWQGRSIDKEAKLKVYNAPGQWKAKTLMFYDNIKNSDFVILTEGPADALKFANTGGFVCTMGKTVSDEQIGLILSSKVKSVYLALDPDAIEEMGSITKKIYSNKDRRLKVFLAEVPQGKKDFGDCTYEECDHAFKEAEEIALDLIQLTCYGLVKS
jgi:DNA primase